MVASRMRRCFMTGKQCIFCGNQAGEGTPGGEVSVFMAMPFRPNLSTSYSWSLKPYLIDQLHLYTDDEGVVRKRKVATMRADEYPHIGAITCEKICRPIQKADVVVVDVTLPNANVMYELGLAIGLSKEIVLVRNQQAWDTDGHGFAKELLDYLNEGADVSDQFKVLDYPGVGYLNSADKPLDLYKSRLSLPARAVTRFSVVGLVHSLPLPKATGDVTVDFASIVSGAIGVALALIRTEPSGEESEGDRRARRVLRELDEAKVLQDKGGQAEGEKKDKEKPRDFEVVTIGSSSSSYKGFKSVRDKIDNAFCCVMDLAGESAAAYLWLGYCHARGINVMPVFRKVAEDTRTDEEKRAARVSVLFSPCPRHDIHSDEFGGETVRDEGRKESPERVDQRVLAFDIRALWYIDFQYSQTEHLAGLLKSVFSELIVRDLPRLERSRFWNRLTQKREVQIYTGAVHNKDLRREMVGDWDQRTVSELVRYLSSTDEAVTPILEPPIYAPEYGLTRPSSDGKTKPNPIGPSYEQLEKYIERVGVRLKNKDCIIVASADVNALTEILLAHAYCGKPKCGRSMFASTNYTSGHTVIALKPPPHAVPPQEPNETEDTLPFLGRVFSRSAQGDETDRLGDAFRGFLVGQQDILKTRYYAQEEKLPKLADGMAKVNRRQESPSGGTQSGGEAKGFLLLSHLLVMKNPFVAPGQRGADAPPLIVVLNGVSGPGTYALAEILTGGVEGSNGGGGAVVEKACASERLLKKVNDLLDTMVESKDKNVVQGIVWVAISGQSEEAGVDLYDIRNVHSWDWCASAKDGAAKGQEESCIVPSTENPWID